MVADEVFLLPGLVAQLGGLDLGAPVLGLEVDVPGIDVPGVDLHILDPWRGVLPWGESKGQVRDLGLEFLQLALNQFLCGSYAARLDGSSNAVQLGVGVVPLFLQDFQPDPDVNK